MNIKEIRELIELIEESAIDELELERSGTRIRLKKTPSTASRATAEPLPNVSAEVAPLPQAETGVAPAENHIFKAPIVGTFYAAPKPDADAFVKVGDQVATGTVLCVIEAMKIFNQIECDAEGEIVRILVQNGEPVEYGQPLFEIRAIG